jgi:copper chaperone
MQLQFKTSINCGSCVKTVSGFLNDIKDIKWEVDTNNPDKILTVEGESLDTELIIDSVESAGFDIEVL